MFSFLKIFWKNKLKEKDKKTVLPNEFNRHRNMGQDTAKALTDEIYSHISSRSVAIKIGYLSYFQEQVEKSIVQEEDDISPLSLAKIEYESIIENTSIAIERLCDEVMNRVDKDWSKVLEALNLDRELISKLVFSKVNDAFHSIAEDGLEILEERADRLKAAEDVWQKKFSERKAN